MCHWYACFSHKANCESDETAHKGGAQLYQVNTHDVQVVIGASVGVAFGKHLEFVGALALKAELSSVNRGLEVRYNGHNHYVDEVVWPEFFSTG